MAVAMELFLFAFIFLTSWANKALSLPETNTTSVTDHQALIYFRSLIRGDPSHALESWGNQSIPMCQWRGVTCGTRGHRRGRVVALDLPEFNILGTIASSVGNLTFLRRLGLQANRFHGAIPAELGRLVELEHLNLSGNSIGGEIPPSLSSCVHLQSVSLHGNNLRGSIPTSLGVMANLRFIDLKNNMLEGAIPPDLGSLHNLEVLSLGYNNLTGNIPSEFGNLTNLVSLYLRGNMISGAIPAEMGRLSNLAKLHLGSNRLIGPIPVSLGNLQELQILYMDRNQLSGPIPSSLGNLSNLEFIDLKRNGLTGSIPESIGNLNFLKVLSLTYNNLIGSIPHSIGKLSALSDIYLNYNQLEGLVPPSVYNLSSLKILVLQFNRLSGSLPLDLGNSLPKLHQFSIDTNQFHGAIPVSLCNASNLEMIQMDSNFLSGLIPRCLGVHLKNLWLLTLNKNQLEAKNDAGWDFMLSLTNCSKLQYISLNDNKLQVVLPSSIANLSTNLETFDITMNNIAGNIPEAIGNLVSLTMLFMNINLLNGTIPSSIGKLERLGALDLRANNLSGPIPETLSNLTMLNQLYLDRNALVGPIPSSLSSCPLQILSMSFNRLAGPIPKKVFLVPTLSDYVHLQENLLTGTLPSEVGKMKNIGTLDISSNRISGEIPASLGECRSLQYLDMHGNLLGGTIPASMAQLKGLLALDLSRNNFSGPIPDFLETINGLVKLNISFNNFQGEVPRRGIFLNATAISIEGNNGLCGGIPELNLPPCSLHAPKRWSHKLVMAISLGSAILCIVLVLALFLFCHHSSRSRKRKPDSSGINGQHIRVSYADLVNATNGFSPENLIGVGSFGSVYKGAMVDHDREVIVAVKVLNLLQRGASQSFVAECETLRCTRHRNLVKILTVCSSIDYNGVDFKALVFEFMPNGNLDQWLHQYLLEDGNHRSFNLIQRIDIAIDVASALEYLHNYKPVPIVHCDLKPSNILLDNYMVAHVGDFGLARFVHQDDTSLPEISSGWATRRGTIGYVAPEYGLGNEVSIHGDMYSYGILLLEMFTGKRPTDSDFVQNLNLHKYVQIALPGQATNVVDQRLLTTTDYGEGRTSNCTDITETRTACITSVLQIGILCSKELPSQRMQIGDALRELQAIRDKYSKHVLSERT